MYVVKQGVGDGRVCADIENAWRGKEI